MHIIDNRKVLMTTEEWGLYQSICKAYDDPPAVKGANLFQNLFESDDQGLITFLRPPTNTCTYEVFLFMVALMVHQRLRGCYKQVNDMHASIDSRFADMSNKANERINALEARIVALEGSK